MPANGRRAAQRDFVEVKTAVGGRVEDFFHQDSGIIRPCAGSTAWNDIFIWLTIPQFPLFIATANGLIYLMAQFEPAFVQQLTLDPMAVRAGEWWRVFTFLFVPPMMSPIFLVFWLLLLYQFAQALENAWGEFRFFFFYFVGAAATVLAALTV